MKPYLIMPFRNESQKLIDICGKKIFERILQDDSVLIVEDDVVINTSIKDHYSNLDFDAIVFLGDLTYTKTYSEDEINVVVLGEFHCSRIIQEYDFGRFFFRKAVITDFAILTSSNGFLEIKTLEAKLLFVAACVYPQISEITSDITIFNSLDENVRVKNMNNFKIQEHDIFDNSIFNDSFVKKFALDEEYRFDDIIGPYSNDIDEFIEYLENVSHSSPAFLKMPE